MALASRRMRTAPAGPGHDAGPAHRHGLLWTIGMVAAALLLLWALSGGRSKPRVTTMNSCREASLVFVPNAAALTSGSQGALTRTASCLSADPTRRVRLVGSAMPDERAGLARARVEATASMLAAHGAKSEQMVLAEVGSGRVCADQDSASCEQQKRAVAIVPLPPAEP